VSGAELSQAAREQVAAALVLLRDWKAQDLRFGCEAYVETVKCVGVLADLLGVQEEFGRVQAFMPRMKIKPRDP